MINRMNALAAAALLATSLVSFANTVSAAPFSGAFAIGNAAPNQVETVGWGGRGWGGGGGWRGGPGWRGRGPGWGYGVGAAVIGGAIIGGALAAPYYYGPPPAAYGPPPGAYAPGGPPVTLPPK
jgi:hypothetical protein